MTKRPTTDQGRATQERIVRAAAELIAQHGAAGTSLDDIRAATQASKSQLYHYFGDKHGLVQAVVDYQCASVLGFQARALASVHDWDGLERWAEAMIAGVEVQDTRGGCPVGTLAAALSDTDEKLRGLLSDAFQAWRDAIRGALARIRDNGLLAADVDLDVLTTMMLSAVQGGLLLAKTSRDSGQLRIALFGAIAYLRGQAPPRQARTTKRRSVPQAKVAGSQRN